MDLSEYQRHDGLGLAALLYQGRVSAAKLMACAIELARARVLPLNGLCYERFEESLALAAGATLKGPFGALPFLLKDSGLASQRFPTSIGSRLFKDLRLPFDATLTTRFTAAGFIPFARTTVPELCMAPTTEARQNGGPTRNPWDPSRSAGGSSGGAAVAVATATVPVAHGNDGGGSIRIPAACCGVYGLKPSRGRVPMGPAKGEGWGGLAAEGVLSRSVRDTAAALDVIGGYEPGAPYAAPNAPASYLKLLDESQRPRYRIARWSAGWDGVAVDPTCVAATEFAAALLRKAGHEVVDVPAPEVDYWKLIEAHMGLLTSAIVVSVDAMTQGRADQSLKDRLEPAIYDGYQRGRSFAAADYVRAIDRFHSVGRRLERFMTGFDLVLTPTLTQPPAALGVYSMDNDFVSYRRKVATYTAFLAVINASGQPAANVPVYWTEAGLPIGVQLIGHFGREDHVLEASAALEEAAPWAWRYGQAPRPDQG